KACPAAVRPTVKDLLLRVVERSQLFSPPISSPHTLVHTLAEVQLWLELAQQGDSWCLLVDVLFRVAYHFNRWVCERVANNITVSVASFSAVFAAALAFFELAFPEAELPRNITSNLAQG